MLFLLHTRSRDGTKPQTATPLEIEAKEAARDGLRTVTGILLEADLDILTRRTGEHTNSCCQMISYRWRIRRAWIYLLQSILYVYLGRESFCQKQVTRAPGVYIVIHYLTPGYMYRASWLLSLSLSLSLSFSLLLSPQPFLSSVLQLMKSNLTDLCTNNLWVLSSNE